MRTKMLLHMSALSVVFAIGTAFLGWWVVPAAACVWGFYDNSEHRPALEASLSAGLGWLILLVWTGTKGPVLELSDRVSGVMGVPSAALIGLTLVFPMALAWGAAVLGESALYVERRLRNHS